MAKCHETPSHQFLLPTYIKTTKGENSIPLTFMSPHLFSLTSVQNIEQVRPVLDTYPGESNLVQLN